MQKNMFISVSRPNPNNHTPLRVTYNTTKTIDIMRRRSKRKSTVMESLTKGHGGLRRSKRKLALKEDESRIYGDDYGILPSD